MTLSQKVQLKYKYLIVGDSGVGKTSIMMRYTQNEFQEEYMSTVGIDFKIKKIETEDFRAVLNIWDTAGQERFRTITKSFYKGSHGIILTYSITDPTSFGHIDSWISQIRNNCNEQTHIILIGCKSDLEEQRKITKEEAKNIANKYKINYFEVSAKKNSGIKEAFSDLTYQIYNKEFKLGVKAQLQSTKDALNKLRRQNEKGGNKKRLYCC